MSALKDRLLQLNPDFNECHNRIFTKLNQWSTRPDKVFQTWKKDTVPRELAEPTRKLHREYGDSYFFLNDRDVDQIMSFVGGNVTHYFQSLSHRIQQIDLFRYVLIFLVGGMYSDLDMVYYLRTKEDVSGDRAIFPMEYDKNTDGVLRDAGISYLVGNYAFYAPAGHEFLLEVVREMISGVFPKERIPKSRVKEVLYTTGPVALTYVYSKTDQSRITLVSPVPFLPHCFGKWGCHLHMGSWR